MRTKKVLLILSIITLIIALLLSIVVINIIKENTKCSKDPFTYAAKRLKQAGGNYDCICTSLDKNLLSFSFSEDGIEILAPKNIKRIELNNITWKK